MNYRHAFHAGNFADVVKHIALVAILLHLRKKDTPFAVIDSHAGEGFLRILPPTKRSAPARRRTASRNCAAWKVRKFPEALTNYLTLVEETGEGGAPAKAGAAIRRSYPGSSLLAAKLLRPQDRLVAIEKHPEEEA